MRKIVVGIARDPKIVPGIEHFVDIESLRMVQRLRVDEKGVAAIWQLQSRSPVSAEGWATKIKGIRRIELLSTDSKGFSLLYIESEFSLGLARFFENIIEGSPYPAFELTPKSIRISFLGTEKGIRSFISQLERINVPYKVLSSGKAKFSRENVLDGLTALQRKALAEAHSNGYFEVPRRITSESLAKRLGIDKSTLSEHLRKAEKRIIDDLLS
jgi:hypothetical protein